MPRHLIMATVIALFAYLFPSISVRADDHWAFQPPGCPSLPAVRDTDWVRTPIDQFILAKLEAKGIRPAARADKRTLIRRATFDLTGLPPTREEVAAFLADDSPDAFARVIERLLASPAYGERWGRHWLDVARYADSNGLDENIAHGNAWRYRDYVVEAFNKDKPYDQFLLEQLAGDLLTSPDQERERRHELLIATGFLSLGPKVLAEVDETKMEMDIIDEQIDTVGRALMGLTLGCARCHDHKFDPISTRDYYSLAGIFKSTKTMESFKKIAKWHENTIATEAELQAKAAHERKIESVQAALNKLGKPENKEQVAERQRLEEELGKLEKSVPELSTAMGVTEGTVTDVAVHQRGSHLDLGGVVARNVPEVLREDSAPKFNDKQSGRLELARWLVSRNHPLTSRVMVNRVWRWHFGKGLVATPDNFGQLGKRPTHPELLDWLACELMDRGWSLKELHRLIMNSSAYQMSSAHDTEAASQDPENQLYWRTEVRRLEAEAIRDSLLAVGGTLDRAMGGSLLHLKNREFFFDHTSMDQTDYHSPRRSLYLPIVRNHLYEVFQLFDCTDAAVANGNRATTTIAPQALFMLNGELVIDMSEKLAAKLLNMQECDDVKRIQWLYQRAYGREPTQKEITRDQALIRDVMNALAVEEMDQQTRRLRAWASLTQTVLAANEFIYVK